MQALSEPADQTIEQEARESHHQQNLASDLYQPALHLRIEILLMNKSVSFPLEPKDVNENDIRVPTSLSKFLVWMLVGDNGEPLS